MGTEAEIVTVLAISSIGGDHIALGNVFSHSNWKFDCVRSCAEAIGVLRENPVPVVICSWQLPDGDWKTVLAEASQHANPPRVIVASPTADEQLWADVLESGGYDVLAQPFQPAEVVRVVSLAWRQWKDQRTRSEKPPR